MSDIKSKIFQSPLAGYSTKSKLKPMWSIVIVDDLQWQIIIRFNINCWSAHSKSSFKWWNQVFKILNWRQPPMEEDLQWKKTSNIKTKISQQPLVISFLNPKHIPKWQNKTLMEDDLKYQKWYISAATGLIYPKCKS